MSGAEAASRLGLTVRHFRRLRRRWEVEGDAAVIHRGRDRPSNRRLEPRLRERALELARDPTYEGFGPTLLAEHVEKDPHGGRVDPSTLRLWLIEAGLWEVTREREASEASSAPACAGRDGADGQEAVDLNALFAETETRLLRQDFTFQHRGQVWQVEAREADGLRPKQKVTIERRLDGRLAYRCAGRVLTPVLFTPSAPAAEAEKLRRPPPRRPVPADHPWRKRPLVVGRALCD